MNIALRTTLYAVMLWTFGGIVVAEEPMTLHPQVEKLDFRSPSRAVLLKDGRFACVRKDEFQVSTDEGKTWQVLSKIPPGPGPKIDNGMLVEDREGRLVALYRDDAGIKFERSPDNMPLPGAQLNVWAARSADGGKTWEHHQRLIDGFCGAMIDILCTREGRIVAPLQELRYGPPRHVTVVFTSDDGGQTWRRGLDLDIGGHGGEDGAFESTVTQRKDGSLLMFLRTTRDALWRSESRDGGLTWAPPVATNIAASNSPAFVRELQSGRLALVWNPLHPEGQPDWPRRVKPRYAEKPDSVYREEMLFALSSDGGETWTKPVAIAKQKGGKLRYAYFMERTPGEIWLALKGTWLRIRESDFDS